MRGQMVHCFASGNTAKGAYSLYRSAFQDVETVFLIQGPPGSGKSDLMSSIAQGMMDRGGHVELYHQPMDRDALEAVLIRDWRIGLVSAEVWPRSMVQAHDDEHAATIHRIDLGEAIDWARMNRESERVAKLKFRMETARRKAFRLFAEALRVHDEWERVYIDRLKLGEADRVAQELIDTLLPKSSSAAQPTSAKVRERFLGAATPQGTVDFIPSLTEFATKRIFIKGRPGSGKSTMLRKLMKAAVARGFDVEVFRCGLDPDSLDMLMFPELRLAIFDSTPPHEHDPQRPGDERLELYERIIEADTDDSFATELQAIRGRYKSTIQQALTYLADAKQELDELRALYHAALDEAVVNDRRQQVESFIDRLMIRTNGN